MFRRSIIAAVAAAAALAVPGAAQAYDFQTPSGNIVCETDGYEYIVCDVQNREATVAMNTYDWAQVYWTEDPLWSRYVLRYNRAFRSPGFDCVSRRSGLTCESNYSGHGFILSAQSIRRF